MTYDPNEPRKSFDHDPVSRRVDANPAPAGFTGLVIGAIVVLGALIAFLMFRADTDTTTLGMNTAPAEQQSPPVTPPSAVPDNAGKQTPATPTPPAPPANNN